MKGYYFITDANLSKAGNLSDVEKALNAHVDVIQYRNKTDTTKEMYEEARDIRETCFSSRKKLIINDRVDIALAVDAHGVHLGQGDLPYHVARDLLGKGKIIGVTVHNLDEAVEAERMGADYIGVSPIFATSTKTDAGAPCGVETIREIKKRCKIPVVAIGGIDLSNVEEVINAGSDMVCAISGVITKDDVFEEIIRYQRRYEIV